MQKREKIKIVLMVVTVFLLLGSTYFLFSNKVSEQVPIQITENEAVEKVPVQENTETRPELVVDKNLATLEINGIKYQNKIEKNTSVYDFMNKIREKGGLDFKDKTYIGMGKFVEEINGIRGNGSEFWIYYVNGKKAQIGVSNYRINPGDVVSWKYEKDIN